MNRKQAALNTIQQAGEEAKRRADPQGYSHEYRAQAEQHQEDVTTLRTMWAEVNASSTEDAMMEAIYEGVSRLNYGILRNRIRLLTSGLKGTLKASYWELTEAGLRSTK